VPPEPDPQARVFLDLRAKKLPALVSVAGAAEYLHFLDALDDEDIDWSLRLPLAPESDLFYVLDKEEFGLAVDGIGERGVRVVVDPTITRHPGTMRQRNLPAELARAGAKLVLIPGEGESGLAEIRNWRVEVGEVVAKGLDRQTALRALTLEPAALLGLADRLGSIEKDKDANLVFFSGDPFEPATRVEAVMIEGEVVYGEVKP
jgi:imidazolonepropionase-like amidohydrolase